MARPRFLRRALPLAAAAVLALHAGCAGAGTPRLLTLPDPSVRPASHVDGIVDYRLAAATVFSTFEREFGFQPFPVVFHFCPDRAGFETALLEAGYDAALARATSQTMDAVGGHRRVLLNESSLARQDWPGRVAAIAHELGHSLQYELGGGERGTSDQWLREGFAEWLAMRVMDRLRAVPYTAARRHYEATLARTRRSEAPRLDAMATFRQWVALNARRDIAPYAQAFLAVDFLIDRHGVDAVVDYFKRFARVQDRSGNFRAAFGEDLADFEEAFSHVVLAGRF